VSGWHLRYGATSLETGLSDVLSLCWSGRGLTLPSPGPSGRPLPQGERENPNPSPLPERNTDPGAMAIAMDASDGAFDESTEHVIATIPTEPRRRRHAVVVRGTDAGAGRGAQGGAFHRPRQPQLRQ